MVDIIWRIIWPVVLFLGINLGVQSVFSWYYVGKNVFESNGELSYGIEVMGIQTVLIMMFTMLITIPVMIVLMKKDEDIKGFRTYKEHYKIISFEGFWLMIPLGIFVCLGLTKLVTIFPIDNIIGSYEKVVQSYNDSNIWLRFLTLCILVPIAEELVYRGMLYKRLKEYNEMTIAAYIAALIFGVVHMNLVQGIYATIAAVILIFVYEKYKTILAPIFLHMVINLMALISGEFVVFEKINNLLLAKIFFMILELFGIVLLVKIIWKRKKNYGSVADKR